VNVNTSLNVRANASKNGEIIGVLYNEDIVQVYDITDDGWAKIYCGGYTWGYVSTQYLTLVEAIKSSRNTTTEEVENEQEKQDDTPQTNSVLFMQECNCLSTQDMQAIESSTNIPKYYTVVNIVDSIDRASVNQYADKYLDYLEDYLKDNKYIEKGTSIISITYIKRYGLIEYRTSSKISTYLQNEKPNKLFDIQNRVRNGQTSLQSGIIEYIDIIGDAVNEYSKKGWWSRFWYGKFCIPDYIADVFFLSGALPSESCWYVNVWHFISKYPFKFAIWCVDLCNSILGGIILICVLSILYKLLILYVIKSLYAKLLLSLIGGLFLLCALCCCGSTCMANMKHIVIMDIYDYSIGALQTITNNSLTPAACRNGYVTTAAVIGFIFKIGLDRLQVSYATKEESDNSNSEMGEDLTAAVSLFLFANGTIMITVALYIWTRIICKIIDQIIVDRYIEKA
jgi:hypothetical protein